MAPERDDAAVVYRYLRDVGPGDVVTLAEKCFPWPASAGMPESTRLALTKRSVGRVFGSILWMRSQGVVVSVRPKPGDLSVCELITVVPTPKS